MSHKRKIGANNFCKRLKSMEYTLRHSRLDWESMLRYAISDGWVPAFARTTYGYAYASCNSIIV